MKVYNYDPITKIFNGVLNASENPLSKGDFLFPAFSTTIEPPSFSQGKQAHWNGSSWEIRDVIKEEETKPYPFFTMGQTQAEIDAELAKPPEPQPLTWDDIRSERDFLLISSDWVFVPDSPIQDKQPWIAYRQALRDVPQNFPTPESVVWPQKP